MAHNQKLRDDLSKQMIGELNEVEKRSTVGALEVALRNSITDDIGAARATALQEENGHVNQDTIENTKMNEVNQVPSDETSLSAHQNLYLDLSEQIDGLSESERQSTIGAVQVALQTSGECKQDDQLAKDSAKKMAASDPSLEGSSPVKKPSMIEDKDEVCINISSQVPSRENGYDPFKKEIEKLDNSRADDQETVLMTELNRGRSVPGAVRVRGIENSSNRSVQRHHEDVHLVNGQEELLQDSAAIAEIVDYDDLEREIREAIVQNTTRAQVVPSTEHEDKRKRLLIACLSCFAIVMVIVTGVVSSSVVKTNESEDEISSQPSVVPSFSPTTTPLPTLVTAQESGIIRCGIMEANPQIGVTMNMEKDLCRAIAAAVFNGNSSKLQIVNASLEERLPLLNDKKVDFFVGIDYSMQREVHDNNLGKGFSFSTPFLYEGMTFGGVPEFVDCAENTDTLFGLCRGLRVCAIEGTTFLERSRDLLPDVNVIGVNDSAIVTDFLNGRCNVVAGIGYSVQAFKPYAESVTNRSYSVGKYKFSKIALTIATRQDDPQWSDFINWILQALLAAEEQNITKSNAEAFPNTMVFGEQYKRMFSAAIGEAGNYAELYETHHKHTPREGLNLLNNGTTGLVTPFQFGPLVQSKGPLPVSGSTMDTITKRGVLRCGITAIGSTDAWKGMDESYCIAIAASLFSGNATSRITYVNRSTPEEGFELLHNRDVDVLAGVPLTLEADVFEPTTNIGYSFSQPFFYPTVQAPIAIATREDDPQWTSFVNWIVQCSFFAEEYEMTQRRSNELPAVNLFGSDYKEMFRHAISAVGNYAEIYEKNLADKIPRQGRNLLNAMPYGPQHFSLFI